MTDIITASSSGIGIIGGADGPTQIYLAGCLVIALIAYMIGNISPSTLMARARGLDIKKEGSGNAGTTNALRVMGKKAGAITLVVDILKGVAAVLLGGLFCGTFGKMICVVAVMLGHIWPVIYRFKGGKGVATAFGALLALAPLLALATLGVVAVGVLISKRMSVGSVLGALAFPVLCGFLQPEFTYAGCALALLIIIKHRANLVRLFKGEEPKLSIFDKQAAGGAEDSSTAPEAASTEPEKEEER